VNNAVYLTYLEEARDAWAHAALGDRFDFVIVRVAIDYRRELSLDDREVIVRCQGAGYGRTSIRTTERILTEDGTVRADAESVIVAHDADGRKARALTDDERGRLDAALG
jgi:acyl-CoA thioesterase FadM